jgi:hypothetical protein
VTEAILSDVSLGCNMKSLAVHLRLNNVNEEQKNDITFLPSQESKVSNFHQTDIFELLCDGIILKTPLNKEIY